MRVVATMRVLVLGVSAARDLSHNEVDVIVEGEVDSKTVLEDEEVAQAHVAKNSTAHAAKGGTGPAEHAAKGGAQGRSRAPRPGQPCHAAPVPALPCVKGC